MSTMANNKLRVTVTVAVEIDRTLWALAYGDESVAEIRDVVKSTADEVVKEHFQRAGVLAEPGA